MMPANMSAKLPHLLLAPSTIILRLADMTIRSTAVAGISKSVGALALCGVLIAVGSMITLGAADDPKNPSTPAKEPAKPLPTAAEGKQPTALPFIDPNAGPLPEGAIARNRLEPTAACRRSDGTEVFARREMAGIDIH